MGSRDGINVAGANDGSTDGTDEGKLVGASEGLNVGTSLGASVGSARVEDVNTQKATIKIIKNALQFPNNWLRSNDGIFERRGGIYR